MEFATRLSRPDSTAENGANPRPLGKQWHVGWPDTRRRGRGNGDRTAPAAQLSAAPAVRNVLDRHFRRGVRLQQADVLVVAMMVAIMLVVMAAHPRIGI